MRVGYHASHEQFSPSELLACVREAEQAGFTAATCSDHFHPWSDAQGGSGFAWSWLGSALQATTLPMGVVTTPGHRYHPTIIAQAGATLAEMYPGRFWVVLGSGEALNEHIVAEAWPPKPERNARLKECVDVIRALWAGETVTHYGRVRVEEARLYVFPPSPPLIIGAALTTETAAWLGGWADGLITINMPQEKHHEVLDAFRAGGGAGKPAFLQTHLSVADSDETARAQAFDQWRATILGSAVLSDLRMPAQFEAAAEFVRPEDLDGHIRISADIERHIAWLMEDRAMGFDEIYLHNVGRNQRYFIDLFGERALPVLGKA